MKSRTTSLRFVELFVSAFFLLFALSTADAFSFLSNQIAFLTLLLCVLFFVFAYLCIVLWHGNEGRKIARSALLQLLFLAMLATFALLLFFAAPSFSGVIVSVLSWFILAGMIFVLYLPVFFLAFVSLFLFKKGVMGIRELSFMLVVVLLILILYHSSKFLTKSITLNDEEFLVLQAVNITLHGGNPYNVSAAQSLFNAVKLTGASVTTNNEIIDRMDYPALFFLSFVPFYFASQPTLANLSNTDLPLQATLFTFLLIIAFALSLKKEYLAKPSIWLLLFFAISVTSIVSITTYIMLAAILLSYRFIESKHAWVFLGICLSLQEQLWLPVLLLIVYSANNNGLRRGVKNLAGAALVFLVTNGYFIVKDPGAYFSALLTPLSRLLLPSGSAPIGFYLVKFYPLLLSSYSALFILTSVLLLLVFAYKNKKELIPLFSAIPLLVLQRALSSYFAFFFFFLVFVFFADSKTAEKEGVIERFLKKNKPVVYATAAVLLALALYVCYSSHEAYEKGFGISVNNQTLSQDTANAVTVYRSVISYGAISVNAAYMYAVVYGDQVFGPPPGGSPTSGSQLPFNVDGFFNQTLIGVKPNCTTYQCLVNTNRIVLPANIMHTNLAASIPWANGTNPITHVGIVLYNGEYLYVANGAT